MTSRTHTRDHIVAMLVTPSVTYLPGDVVTPTPDGVLTAGLGALLTRVQARYRDEGVLLVDGRAAVALGLPVNRDELGRAGIEDHPALKDARAAGWQASALRAWLSPGRPWAGEPLNTISGARPRL